jgi:hypothetical protein
MLTFSHPGSRIPDPGVKKHPIPDPGSGSATLVPGMFRLVFKKAREDPRSNFHVYVSAALMEYYCSKVFSLVRLQQQCRESTSVLDLELYIQD